LSAIVPIKCRKSKGGINVENLSGLSGHLPFKGEELFNFAFRGNGDGGSLALSRLLLDRKSLFGDS